MKFKTKEPQAHEAGNVQHGCPHSGPLPAQHFIETGYHEQGGHCTEEPLHAIDVVKMCMVHGLTMLRSERKKKKKSSHTHPAFLCPLSLFCPHHTAPAPLHTSPFPLSPSPLHPLAPLIHLLLPFSSLLDCS